MAYRRASVSFSDFKVKDKEKGRRDDDGFWDISEKPIRVDESKREGSSGERRSHRPHKERHGSNRDKRSSRARSTAGPKDRAHNVSGPKDRAHKHRHRSHIRTSSTSNGSHSVVKHEEKLLSDYLHTDDPPSSSTPPKQEKRHSRRNPRGDVNEKIKQAQQSFDIKPIRRDGMLSNLLTDFEFDARAKRLATLDLDESSIRISRKKRRERAKRRERRRTSGKRRHTVDEPQSPRIHTFSKFKNPAKFEDQKTAEKEDERPKTARPRRTGGEHEEKKTRANGKATAKSGSLPKKISKDLKSEHARRMSMINDVSFSGAFTICVGAKVVRGCYIRYTDETETRLSTGASSATRAGSVSVISLWKDEQTGKNSSVSNPRLHLVPFLSLEDLFEVLEKRYMDDGKEKGNDFDIDDYSSEGDAEHFGKVPDVLKGLTTFKYAQLMKADDGLSFEGDAKLMRARDVYARLLLDCSIHMHRHVGYVMACISSKLNPKTVGEIIKSQHEKMIGGLTQEEVASLESVKRIIPGCTYPKQYCPYMEESKRLKEELKTKHEEVLTVIESIPSEDNGKMVTQLNERVDELVVQKLQLEKDVRRYKLELEESKLFVDMQDRRIHILNEELDRTFGRGKLSSQT
jgi:hypothetical protein